MAHNQTTHDAAKTTHDAAKTTHDEAPIAIYVAYAHPIGEDDGVVWIAAARTRDAARAKLQAQIDTEWGDEGETTDLDDGSWSCWIVEDTI